MTAGAEQIVRAYEILGMSPDDIAMEQELDVLSIKACLVQFSEKYRDDIKSECKAIVPTKGDEVPTIRSLGFTEMQEQMALDTIANLAQYSEDENVQLRAAKYIRDDRTGRMDVVSKLGNLNVNVFSFNEQLKRAIQATQFAKENSVEIQAKQQLVLDE